MNNFPTVSSRGTNGLPEEYVFSSRPTEGFTGRGLRSYWLRLLKRRWVVLGVFLAVVGTVGIITFTTTPIYKATTQILIERETPPHLLDIRNTAPTDPGAQEFYQTQYKLLESRALARKVMEKLNLDNHSNYRKFFDRLPRDAEPVERQRAEEKLVTALLKKVEVTPIRNSRLVEVSFSDPDPHFAALVVNTLAKSYSDLALDMRFAAAHEAGQWLQQKMVEARHKLEESEDKLNQYKRVNNIVTQEDKETMTSQRLTQLNQELMAAQSRRIEAETRYDQVSKGRPIAEVLNNPVIQQLKGQEGRLLADNSDLSHKYGELHPRRQQLAGELSATRGAIAAELATIAQTVKHQYQMAKDQETKLLAAMEKVKGESQDQGDKAVQYQVLWRDVQANRAMYENMLKGLKETTATQNIPATHIQIVYPATAPSKPVTPQTMRNLMLAIVLGFVGGMALAMSLETMDNTFKSPEEVEAWLEQPNLALIPHLDLVSSNGHKTPALVVENQPNSLPAESFRSLRTSIMFSAPGQAPHTLLLTSAQPGEGKSVNAANLATVMAKADTAVLLVDADLRRPTQHQVFDLPREPGLSNFLVGEIDELPVVATSVPNLWLLPAGPTPPNPSELLQSERMRQFLDLARSRFERVIIDSPPLLSVTDATILATMVEGVLQVVKAEASPRKLAQEARDQLLEVQAHLLGTIVNDVPTGLDGVYYNYYYRYYSNYYTDKGDKQSRQRNLPATQAAASGMLSWLKGKKDDRQSRPR